MRRHDVDLVSLLAALFAAAGAVLYLLHDAGRVSLPVRTVGALVAAAFLVIAVAWALASRRSKDRPPPGQARPAK